MALLILYYLFLFLVTAAIVLIAKKTWKITNDFCLPLSVFFIYYFTLAGAIIFPIDTYFGHAGTAIGLHYLHIFDRLFPVKFDTYYFQAVIYYSVFILIFQLAIFFYAKKYFKPNPDITKSSSKIYFINPYWVMLVSFGMIALSIYCLHAEIITSIRQCRSVYLLTRHNTNRLYTIHQLGNEFCVIIPFLVYSLSFIKQSNNSLQIKKVKFGYWILTFTCIIAALYICLLGNRRETLSGIIICTLLFLKHIKSASIKRYLVLLGIVLFMFLNNDFSRSTIIPRFLHHTFMRNQPIEYTPDEFFLSDKVGAGGKIKQMLSSVVFSNELFYAHFSMYGALRYNIDFTYGSSFKCIAYSLVPRSIIPNRPDDIYTYYVKEVHALPGQIYTMHHATAWYLNFGFIGIVISALILALFFIVGFQLNSKKEQIENKFLRILADWIIVLISAQLVTFITAGPEGYKAMILEGIFLPVLTFTLISKKQPTTK